MSQIPYGLPGIGATPLKLIPRKLFIMDTAEGDWLPGGRIIDGFSTRDPDNTIRTDEIRPGLILGKVTSSVSGSELISGYATSIIGITQVAYATTQSTISLSVAAAVEITRRIGSTGTFTLTGPPTSSGTVAAQSVVFSAINVTTGTATITPPTAAAIAGSWVGAIDGSQTPFTVFCGDVFPIRVTDVNGNNQNVPLRQIPISYKVMDTSNIINYPSNAKLISFLKSSLRTAAPALTFSDDF